MSEIADLAREAVVARPGDTLVVRMAETLSHGQLDDYAARLRAALKEKMPDVEVCLIGGVEQLLVYRPDPA